MGEVVDWGKLRYAGLAAPVMFGASVVVMGWVTPGYDALDALVSALGAGVGWRPWVFNTTAFFSNGLLLLGFAVFLHGWLRQYQRWTLAAWLIGIHGLGMVLAAWFSCDQHPRCSPPDPSPEQQLHNVLAAIKFPALILAMPVLGAQFWRLSRRGLAIFSLSACVLAVVALGVFLGSVQSEWGAGLYQRGLLLVLYGWVAGVAWRL